MTITVEVKTVAAGKNYRATVRDGDDRLIGKYQLMLADDMVSIFTPDYNLGAYRLARFGGNGLTPNSVRKFFLSLMEPTADSVSRD